MPFERNKRASMDIKHHVIPLLRPWVNLPAPGTLTPIVKDNASMFKETPPDKVEFTETDLRVMALSGKTGLPSIVVNASYFDIVPAGFLSLYYHHLRYEFPLPAGWLPIRSGMQFGGGVHRLAAYVILERIFQKLLIDYSKTTDPELKFKSRNIHLLVTKIRYMIFSILAQNPTVANPENVIVSSYIEMVGNTDITETRHIFFDAGTLADYEATGKTVNDAIDWYLTHGSQPEF